jgi:hypothetical protein
MGSKKYPKIKRLKLKKSKIRKGVNQSNKIGLNRIKIQKLDGFKNKKDPSPKKLKE